MNSNDFCMKFAEASRGNPRPLFRVRQLHEFQRRELNCAKGLYFSRIFREIQEMLEKVRQFYEFHEFLHEISRSIERQPAPTFPGAKVL